MCPLSSSFYGNGCFAIVSITDTGARAPTRMKHFLVLTVTATFNITNATNIENVYLFFFMLKSSCHRWLPKALNFLKMAQNGQCRVITQKSNLLHVTG